MKLVVAEKPSVARDLARVLGVRDKGAGFLEGEGLVITWCVGHLVELEEPAHYDPAWRRWSLDTLPMVPEQFELRPRKGASDQWKVVRRLLRDPRFAEVVNACDAGREGELIFRYAYELAGCARPIRRLWLSAMTDEAIRRAWGRLEPGQRYEALADAARCRSEADWLVGLNATRAMTCLARQAGGDQLLSVGRVQTPTLALIVARDRAIETFVPETFWLVKGTFEAAEARWEAAFFRPGVEEGEREESDEASHAERLPDEETARAVVAATEGRQGVVAHAERKRQVDRPPLLYDLTALQRRANQRYGLPADKTLELAQALYERHKLITYPRTDARYLTTDQVPGLPDVVRGLAGVPVYQPFADAVLAAPIQPGRRVVDDAEVGDHHAIIPTGRTPRSDRLSPDEKRIFDLVARRFLAALSPDALFDKTLLVVAVEADRLPEGLASPLRFRARGRICVREGWRAVDPPPSSKEVLLPLVPTGAPASNLSAEAKPGQTRPPRPYTDASLLHAMETAGRELTDEELKRAMRNAGLGTPATRAAILQTLLQRAFIVREKRTIRATDRGRALIDAVPVDELKSAELTARYEARLAAMAEGREARDAFMRDVVGHAHQVVRAIAAADPPPAEVTTLDTPVLGACPVCHTPVREGRSVFACETGRSCAFVVFKSMAKRRISARMVKELLETGRSKAVKGFRSKKGKEFTAGLALEESGRVGLWFPDRREAAPGAPTPVGMPCPSCGQGRIVAGRAAWGCDRWREGCRYVLPFEDGGRRLSEGEAARRVRSSAGPAGGRR